MTNDKHHGLRYQQKVLVFALIAAFGPAQAADDKSGDGKAAQEKPAQEKPAQEKTPQEKAAEEKAAQEKAAEEKAEKEKLAAMTNPDAAAVSVGVGWVSGDSADRAFFGQYNGLRANDFNLLLDYFYIKRDETGLWTRSVGRNLGLDVLDIGGTVEKQGDWGVTLGYNQFHWRDPRTINTNLQGVGSTSPMIGNALTAPGTGSNYDLSVKRKDLGLAASKWLTPNLSFDASYKYEDKDGSRLFGIGGYCSNVIAPVCAGARGTVGALYLTPEPISSTTQQFDAKLNYSGGDYGLTFGYYGGFYNSGNPVMTPVFPGGASTITNTGDMLGTLAANLSQPIALPPDNQSNQLYLTGYAGLPLNTRINYKAAYTHATQNSTYPGELQASAAPGFTSLGGAMDTTLLQAGLTSRPLAGLTINGSARWEDRHDDTDLGNYVVSPNGTLYTNNPHSSQFGNAKLEAGYQLTDVGRGTLGVDYAYFSRDRPVMTTWMPDNSMAGMRESNNETGVYVDFRRSMAETFNGAVTYRYAKRQGYHWYTLDAAAGFPFVRYDSFTNASGTFPLTMLDRTRQTIKLTGDWSPTNAFSMNFSIEDGKDSYDGPTDAGLNDSKVQFYNVDAAWQVSANWKATAYASFGKQNLNMQQGIGYIADLEQKTFAAGLGVVGKIRAGFDVGGELSYLDDKNSYNLGMTTGAPVDNLPNTSYRATILKLWGKYAIDKKSDIRVDLIQQWADYDDWQWGSNGVPFTYSDNSTITIQPTQNVTFLGVRYIYRFK